MMVVISGVTIWGGGRLAWSSLNCQVKEGNYGKQNDNGKQTFQHVRVGYPKLSSFVRILYPNPNPILNESPNHIIVGHL